MISNYKLESQDIVRGTQSFQMHHVVQATANKTMTV